MLPIGNSHDLQHAAVFALETEKLSYCHHIKCTPRTRFASSGCIFSKHTVPPEYFARGRTIALCPIQLRQTHGRYLPNTWRGRLHLSPMASASLSERCDSGAYSVRGHTRCPAFIYAFLLRFWLYSERGFITSRQSRSPRSSAMMSTSAVAILVATGMLYISHIRSNSCSVSS